MFSPGQQPCQSPHIGSPTRAVIRSQPAHAECAPMSATVAPPPRGPYERIPGSDPPPTAEQGAAPKQLPPMEDEERDVRGRHRGWAMAACRLVSLRAVP